MKWTWNPKLVCKLQIPFGFSFRRAHIVERDIMLERANCTKIQMEVLQCEYHLDFASLLKHKTRTHYYAIGPRSELYYITLPHKSSCNDFARGTVYYQILSSEGHVIPRDVKLLGLANIFQIFIDKKKGKLLRKRKWPLVSD